MSQEASEPREFAPVFGILIGPPFHGNSVRLEERIAIAVAREEFAKDSGAKVRLLDGGSRAENPAPGASPDQIRLEAGVNAVLASQLPVVIDDGVERLSEIGGVVRRENGGAAGFVPATPAEGRLEAQREALDLPSGVAALKLKGSRRTTLLDKELLEGQKSVGLVSVGLGVVVQTLIAIFAPQQIRVYGMLDQISLASAKVGTKRLRQIFYGGSVHQPVGLLAPAAGRQGKGEGQHRDQHSLRHSRHLLIGGRTIQHALISDCIL